MISPHWVWLTVALPLFGFLANGALALGRPVNRRLVSIIGVGVLTAAFLVSLGIFLQLWRQP
ncbi:MAG TPA: hypothetical protein VFD73_23805, partial [Gemmatimonadales bacterium]|nr:hypothetical protein [Gemmatimonadales bacterium]